MSETEKKQWEVDNSENQPFEISQKPLEVFSTRQVLNMLGKEVAGIFIFEMLRAFKDHPFDMFVLEPRPDGRTDVRLAGYHFTTMKLDEKSIVFTINFKIPETLWFKVDDYKKSFIGTLLFPEEY